MKLISENGEEYEIRFEYDFDEIKSKRISLIVLDNKNKEVKYYFESKEKLLEFLEEGKYLF